MFLQVDDSADPPNADKDDDEEEEEEEEDCDRGSKDICSWSKLLRNDDDDGAKA